MKAKKKQDVSNEARLESIKHRHEHYNQSQQIIQTSLKNLNASKNKHIIFDDGDVENVIPAKKAKTEAPKDESIKKKSSKKKNTLGKSVASDNISTKQHIIFDDEDDENTIPTKTSKTPVLKRSYDPLNIENGNEDITISAPTSSKKSNEKLLAMQEKVGKDGRFKIDKRFVENDSKNDSNDTNSATGPKSKEVKANLAVFHQVMGPLTVSNVGKQSVHFSDPSAKRYDPSEMDVESQPNKEVEFEEPKEKKVKTVVPKVSKKQFYDVSTIDLKQAFTKTETVQQENDCDSNKPFSLLSMLGRDHDKEEVLTANDASNYKTENFEKLNNIVSKLHSSKIFEYDSSDMSDNDDENKLEQIKSSDVRDESIDSDDKTRFFLLSKIDSKFNIAKKLSNRHKLDKDWNETRADVIEQCKNWHKNASSWNKNKKSHSTDISSSQSEDPSK